MIDRNNIDLTEIGRWYLVANTPGFLFRNLRITSQVRFLAETYSTEELIDEIAKLAEKDRLSVIDLIVSYACVVALSMKNPQEVISGTRNLPINRIVWLRELLALSAANTRITQVSEFGIPPGTARLLRSQVPNFSSVDSTIFKIGYPNPAVMSNQSSGNVRTNVKEVKIDTN